VLLGPPGAGKTIFLECLCGLKQIDGGRIVLDNRDVTALEPRSRSIGYVPQDYALFPHLSVRGNIRFGLKVAGVDAVTAKRRVQDTAEMLGIEHLLDRRIAGLSGGEKQRTALGRALVIEPRLLLLDEPVCALDEGTRQRICSLLHTIQRKLGLTVIHVSHNLEEAFSVADVAAIFHQGRLLQMGALNQLLRQPTNEFVARFMRCENILAAVAEPDADGEHSVATVGDVRLRLRGAHSGAVKLVIRPEDVVLGADGSEVANGLSVSVVRWRDYGAYMKVELRGPGPLIAHVPHSVFGAFGLQANQLLRAQLPAEVIAVLGSA